VRKKYPIQQYERVTVMIAKVKKKSIDTRVLGHFERYYYCYYNPHHHQWMFRRHVYNIEIIMKKLVLEESNNANHTVEL
jgi:hypothetical protein